MPNSAATVSMSRSTGAKSLLRAGGVVTRQRQLRDVVVAPRPGTPDEPQPHTVHHRLVEAFARDRQVVARDRKWGCATSCHAAMLFAQSFQRSNAAARL